MTQTPQEEYVAIMRALAASQERVRELERAARLARSALDGLMGDSDLEGDDSLEIRAMQALSAALRGPESPE